MRYLTKLKNYFRTYYFDSNPYDLILAHLSHIGRPPYSEDDEDVYHPTPRTAKPPVNALCPRIPPGQVGICIFECRTDSNCQKSRQSVLFVTNNTIKRKQQQMTKITMIG
jgi:hypothetical protein